MGSVDLEQKTPMFDDVASFWCALTNRSWMCAAPGPVRRGRPLVCVSAARLYDEVPVCHECYQVYSQMADEWKRRTRSCGAPSLPSSYSMA